MSDAPKDHRLEDVLAYKQEFLEGPQLAEFEAHLRDCASCQATLESVSRFLPAVQQALTTPELPSTVELWATVQAQFRAQQEKKKPRRSLVALRIWMTAATLAAGTAVFFVLRAASPDVVGAPQPGPTHKVDAGVDAGVGEDAGEGP